MGDLLRALGQGEQAKTFYEKSLRISERLAADEPNRADYQRDLSVSYEKMGDLLRALGQGEQAKTFYEKSLRIRERLAADEPNRADYQRDLSVSYNNLGDLLSALRQGEQAKTFYEKSLRIRERLAADEPNRADYQRDVSVPTTIWEIYSALSGRASRPRPSTKSLSASSRYWWPTNPTAPTTRPISWSLCSDGGL